MVSIEEGHSCDVWQGRVDEGHRGSNSTDNTLQQVEVGEKGEVFPVPDGGVIAESVIGGLMVLLGFWVNLLHQLK